jgi:hypothetical protein
MMILMSTFENIVFTNKGPDTPDAIQQRDAIFRFSLTGINFDPCLNFLNI